VVGDIHGDLNSLDYILDHFQEGMAIFLGDYGDRGEEQIEVYLKILGLKTKYPDRVVMLRGNHETDDVYPHDLPTVLEKRYGKDGEGLHQALQELWSKLPILALGNYAMVHGGAPSRLESLDRIGDVENEILWNDPGDIDGSDPSMRGIGNVFGKDVTRDFLDLTGAKTLIRSHQPCDGIKVWHDGMGITLFSRLGPPYQNELGAYLNLDLQTRFDGYGLARVAKRFSAKDLSQ